MPCLIAIFGACETDLRGTDSLWGSLEAVLGVASSPLELEAFVGLLVVLGKRYRAVPPNLLEKAGNLEEIMANGSPAARLNVSYLRMMKV